MGNLIKNERTKLYKKVSTWVLTGIIVTMAVGLLLLQGIENAFTVTYSVGDWESEYTSELNTYHQWLKEDPNDVYTQIEIEKYEYLLTNQIDPAHWKYGLVIEHYNSLAEKKDYETQYTPEELNGDPYYEDLCTTVEKNERLLKSDDWKDYVRAQIAEIEADNTDLKTAEERQVQIEIWNMYLDLGITPITQNLNPYYYYDYYGRDLDSVTWQQQEIESIRQNKLALLRNQTVISNMPLSASDREKLEGEIAVSTERLKTGTPAIASDSLYGLMETSFSSFGLLSLLIAVIAGGIIANEFSHGTIKLLLITPHNRQRVFWAKAWVPVELTLLAGTAIFVLHFLISGLFNGFGDIGATYMGTLFGKVVRLPYFVVMVYKYLLALLPVLMVGATALMLSAVTRKPIAAISVSLLFYVGGSLASLLLGALTESFVIPISKFLPFCHFDLNAYFPQMEGGLFNITEMSGLESLLPDPSMTLGFSVAVLAIYILCFTWIAHDSFCRRDVK